MSKSLVAKTVLRTIIYQIILVFIGVSIGFILNAKYVGNRSAVVERSINNIFNPIEYDDRVKRALIQIGRDRLYIESIHKCNGQVEIIADSEKIKAEEWYQCTFKYVDADGIVRSSAYNTRIRWKPWEYYYDLEEQPWNPTLYRPANGAIDDEAD